MTTKSINRRTDDTISRMEWVWCEASLSFHLPLPTHTLYTYIIYYMYNKVTAIDSRQSSTSALSTGSGVRMSFRSDLTRLGPIQKSLCQFIGQRNVWIKLNCMHIPILDVFICKLVECRPYFTPWTQTVALRY